MRILVFWYLLRGFVDSVVPITYEAATGGKQWDSKHPRIQRKIRPSKVTQIRGSIRDGISVYESHNSVLCLFRWAADMPSRLRKTWKLPGNVSHSHGCLGKHQKHPGPRVVLVACVIRPGSTSTNHTQVTLETLFLKQSSYYYRSQYYRYWL